MFDSYLFFYGHTGNFDKNPKVCLSQWYPATFWENGLVFPTSEHYMMYKKALLFGDSDSALLCLRADTPRSAKRYGRKVKNFDSKIWDANKFNIVQQGNLLKFSQNTLLKEYLLSIRDKYIVEASKSDSVWGIGSSLSEAKQDVIYDNIEIWGQNLLGKALISVSTSLF